MEQQKKAPLGVLILGGFNFFILGIVSLIAFGSMYLNLSSAAIQTILEEFRKYFPRETLGEAQLKTAFILQIAIAAVFTLSGYGLLRGKEWGRRLTLYFAFVMAGLVFLTVLFSAAFAGQAILQVIYPGILIFYFTNKKIQDYFVPPKIEKTEEEKE